jgi:hypothetical protein
METQVLALRSAWDRARRIGGIVAVEIEFSMYCKRCGLGICGNTNYIQGSSNNFETSCPRCEKELEEALATIASLEGEIEELKAQLEKAEEK